MGCSASKAESFITKDEQHPSVNVYCDTYLTPISRTLCFPSPFVLHPPSRKGDTNHLVYLTSTTYGSLVLVDPIKSPKDANFNGQETSKLKNVGGSCNDHLSPDSVINTWGAHGGP
ncbi:hypothetical protein LIER_26000 [Lithospermum erythrorhizon]|uniref:Uncharacterized protein n=1 Tax=Lithospermum erythrorhizon TaxID=34254 RepID=A0AAV3R731_LITER